MTIISGGAQRQPDATFYQMRAEELLKHNASVAAEVNGAEHGVKTAVLSHMNACRHAYRQASPILNKSTVTCPHFFLLTRTFINLLCLIKAIYSISPVHSSNSKALDLT